MKCYVSYMFQTSGFCTTRLGCTCIILQLLHSLNRKMKSASLITTATIIRILIMLIYSSSIYCTHFIFTSRVSTSQKSYSSITGYVQRGQRSCSKTPVQQTHTSTTELWIPCRIHTMLKVGPVVFVTVKPLTLVSTSKVHSNDNTTLFTKHELFLLNFDSLTLVFMTIPAYLFNYRHYFFNRYIGASSNCDVYPFQAHCFGVMVAVYVVVYAKVLGICTSMCWTICFAGVIIFASDQEVGELMKAVKRRGLTGKFSWIGSDGWGGRGLAYLGKEAEVGGTHCV